MEGQNPITIFRGDDSDAFGLRTITIKITGDLSLADATAKFTLLGFTKTWTNAETATGTLTMTLTDEDTANMPLGRADGTLRLYDDDGKQLTVTTTIPFLVTNRVFGSPADEYTVDVTLAVDTEINITFSMSAGSNSLWQTNPSGKSLSPLNNSIERICVPDLASVQPIGSTYTLADVKNLVNTILASLKA